jgi:hypothetical protein
MNCLAACVSIKDKAVVYAKKYKTVLASAGTRYIPGYNYNTCPEMNIDTTDENHFQHITSLLRKLLEVGNIVRGVAILENCVGSRRLLLALRGQPLSAGRKSSLNPDSRLAHILHQKGGGFVAVVQRYTQRWPMRSA